MVYQLRPGDTKAENEHKDADEKENIHSIFFLFAVLAFTPVISSIDLFFAFYTGEFHKITSKVRGSGKCCR